jgi:hypothetical protein
MSLKNLTLFALLLSFGSTIVCLDKSKKTKPSEKGAAVSRSDERPSSPRSSAEEIELKNLKEKGSLSEKNISVANKIVSHLRPILVAPLATYAARFAFSKLKFADESRKKLGFAAVLTSAALLYINKFSKTHRHGYPTNLASNSLEFLAGFGLGVLAPLPDQISLPAAK